jgi:formate hydrogenlyase subunit 6/NADH:ubiquinone oxidoreductase subunit I
MIFKTVTKRRFQTLVERLLEKDEVIAPTRTGVNNDGKPIHQYLPVQDFEAIDLDYVKTDYSAKTYFLPFRETLSTYHFEGADWRQDIHYRIQPRVLLGLHACDINSLLKLDKVLVKDYFPNPYYLSRRKNTFIVGIDHDPGEDCFCQSVGADTVTHGFDLFLTDLGEKYFVAVNSDRGFNTLQTVDPKDITERDTQAYLQVRQRIREGFFTHLNVHDLPNLLDIEFESPVWKKWGSKCLSCGSCAMVCPTCYCYGVTESVSLDSRRGIKIKHLYSCSITDFAMVAGGHNFRPGRETRLKYRYYHQHRGFTESYDEPKCVGCNRCGRACLAGINPRDVIRDLQAEKTG